MPFQPINFLNAQILEPTKVFPDDLGQKMAQAYSLYKMPEKFAQESETAKIANAFKQMEIKSKESQMERMKELLPIESGLKQAQTQDYLQKIETNKRLQNSPLGFLQHIAPGDAGVLQSIYEAEQSTDPIARNFAKDLRRSFETNIANKQSIQNQRKIYADTRQYAISPTMTKLNTDLDDINSGFMPGTGKKQLISEDKQNELRSQYEAKLEKESEQTQIIQRRRYAANIEKTINSIDPKILTQYSGANGLKRYWEQVKAPFGQESSEYDSWSNMFNKAHMFATQVRQFYGESIQPSMREKLEKLTDPSGWISNPDLALSNYNSIVDILRKETSTYFQSPSQIKKEALGESGSNKKPKIKLKDFL
jgi:hypothetical protein